MTPGALNSKRAISYAAALLSGLAIGWLAGLSSSPVAGTLITSVLGLAAAAVMALSGLKEDDKGLAAAVATLDPVPVVLFALGILYAKWKSAPLPTVEPPPRPEGGLLNSSGKLFCDDVATMSPIDPNKDLAALKNKVIGFNLPGLGAVANQLDGGSLKAAVQSLCNAVQVNIK